MILITETNFVLELAFRQDEVRECDRLVELAVDGTLELAVPACSLFEPYETLVRRSKARDSLLEAFKREVNELARSEFYVELPRTAEEIVKPISGSSNVYENSLREALLSIVRVATIIPLSSEVMNKALEFQEGGWISPQDSVVLASVFFFVRDRAGDPKLFANTNMKDFVRPDVATHFRQYNCKLLNSFTAARHLAERVLQG